MVLLININACHCRQSILYKCYSFTQINCPYVFGRQGASMTQLFEQASQFTSEIVGWILATDSRHLCGKESVNAVPPGNVYRVGWDTPQTDLPAYSCAL
jgi:hypothetical protein